MEKDQGMMKVFQGRRKIDVRLEMVAEDSLFRSIGTNKTKEIQRHIKIPRTKEPPCKLAILANPLLIPMK